MAISPANSSNQQKVATPEPENPSSNSLTQRVNSLSPLTNSALAFTQPDSPFLWSITAEEEPFGGPALSLLSPRESSDSAFPLPQSPLAPIDPDIASPRDQNASDQQDPSSLPPLPSPPSQTSEQPVSVPSLPEFWSGFQPPLSSSIVALDSPLPLAPEGSAPPSVPGLLPVDISLTLLAPHEFEPSSNREKILDQNIGELFAFLARANLKSLEKDPCIMLIKKYLLVYKQWNILKEKSNFSQETIRNLSQIYGHFQRFLLECPQILEVRTRAYAEVFPDFSYTKRPSKGAGRISLNHVLYRISTRLQSSLLGQRPQKKRAVQNSNSSTAAANTKVASTIDLSKPVSPTNRRVKKKLKGVEAPKRGWENSFSRLEAVVALFPLRGDSNTCNMVMNEALTTVQNERRAWAEKVKEASAEQKGLRAGLLTLLLSHLKEGNHPSKKNLIQSLNSSLRI